MDGARWRQIQDVFHHALTLSATEQPAYLHKACADDHELFSEVSSMLEQDAGGNSVLDHGVG